MGLFTNSIKPAGGLSSGYRGGIIQMKYTPVTGVVSSGTDSSGVHVSSFDTTITPTSTNSRIIIQGTFGAVSSNGGNTFGITVRRGSSVIDAMRGNSDGSRGRYTMRGATTWNADQNHCHSYAFTVIDHPSTTSSTTYRIYASVEGNHTIYFNRNRYNGNNSNPIYSRVMSSMLVMEVSA
tara:strand:+ start:1100 stop:1639 length:540 start_codon:yes stop_codon:yes gene_type:complete